MAQFRIFAHRGNTLANPNVENNPESVLDTLATFSVELDVWWHDDHIFLGHDNPEHKVDIEFLRNKNIICHAKTISTLSYLNQFGDINVFFQERDDICLTSQGFEVVQSTVSPGVTPHPNTIFVDLDGNLIDKVRLGFLGVITDVPEKYLKISTPQEADS